MTSYVWPIALVIFSNIFYHICAKSTPGDVHPFAALTVTYLTSAPASGILYFVLTPQANLLKECSRINWATFVLGITIIGLEGGWLYAYKAGWQVNTGFLVQSVFVSVLLLFVGYFLYHDALTWNKLVGVFICLLGLFFINLR